MRTKLWWSIIGVVFVIIVILTAILVLTPAPVHAPVVTQPEASSSPADAGQTATSTEPLHTKVVVTAPVPNETVGHTLTVTGKAPGNWYFEASFPIKVTSSDGSTIGVGHAEAQSDWMTTAQVPFTAIIDLNMAYSGPATVALLRDNPSGLPQNDDSLEIPIVVQ